MFCTSWVIRYVRTMNGISAGVLGGAPGLSVQPGIAKLIAVQDSGRYRGRLEPVVSFGQFSPDQDVPHSEKRF